MKRMLIWDENKRQSNFKKHELDFADLARFDAANAMFGEDTRFAYPERRFIALGLLDNRLVQVVYAEIESGWRVISLRPASRKERKLWQRE
jgi:uncharacterized DUF497 family protein